MKGFGVYFLIISVRGGGDVNPLTNNGGGWREMGKVKR